MPQRAGALTNIQSHKQYGSQQQQDRQRYHGRKNNKDAGNSRDASKSRDASNSKETPAAAGTSITVLTRKLMCFTEILEKFMAINSRKKTKNHITITVCKIGLRHGLRGLSSPLSCPYKAYSIKPLIVVRIEQTIFYLPQDVLFLSSFYTPFFFSLSRPL
jgi:hypothetical protein